MVFKSLLPLSVVLLCFSASAYGQSFVFQDGVTVLPGGGFYEGTVDTEFRAANPTTPQGEKNFVTVDQFDGGFQTQGAIRFENLLASQGGLLPDSNISIVFAELKVRVSSSTGGNISFNRILGPDTTTGNFWTNDDTWLSLGGDLEPDQETGLLDGDPILRNDVEAASTPDFVLATSPSGIDQRFDVTDAVVDWLILGQPNFGWAISNDSGDGFDFRSAEFGDEPSELELRPSLTIAFQSIGGAGDLNLDTVVDLLDYQLLLDNMAIELDGPIATGAPGDLDFDRDVDLDDFTIFKSVFPGGTAGLQAALAASSAAVPEPSTMVLAAGMLVAAGLRLRR